jgi:hypothetical protein
MLSLLELHSCTRIPEDWYGVLFMGERLICGWVIGWKFLAFRWRPWQSKQTRQELQGSSLLPTAFCQRLYPNELMELDIRAAIDGKLFGDSYCYYFY